MEESVTDPGGGKENTGHVHLADFLVSSSLLLFEATTANQNA
jgi:hypothetical protein